MYQYNCAVSHRIGTTFSHAFGMERASKLVVLYGNKPSDADEILDPDQAWLYQLIKDSQTNHTDHAHSLEIVITGSPTFERTLTRRMIERVVNYPDKMDGDHYRVLTYWTAYPFAVGPKTASCSIRLHRFPLEGDVLLPESPIGDKESSSSSSSASHDTVEPNTHEETVAEFCTFSHVPVPFNYCKIGNVLISVMLIPMVISAERKPDVKATIAKLREHIVDMKPDILCFCGARRKLDDAFEPLTRRGTIVKHTDDYALAVDHVPLPKANCESFWRDGQRKRKMLGK